jgi:hypothetical protein
MNISAIALGGLQQAQAELERVSKQTAQQAAPASDPGQPVDAISLSNEAVALMIAKTQFEVNINDINAAYRAEKALLEATGRP